MRLWKVCPGRRLERTWTRRRRRAKPCPRTVIRLKVDCRGEPIGFSALLEPTMAVYFDRARGAFVAKVESLPIKLGSFGTIALDRYLDPIELPVSFSQTLESGLPGLTIDTVIRDVKVLEDRIEAKADLVFKKLAPPSQNAARARSKP